MIRSMTAYASAEFACLPGALVCEVRSVNHRYLEQSPRLPDELRGLEPLLREIVSGRLSRGKVDVVIRLRGEQRSDALEINQTLLLRLSELHLDLVSRFPGLVVQSTELLRFPGVLQQPEVDKEVLQQAFVGALEQALDALTASREREGGKLAVLIVERLAGIEKIVAELRSMMPEIRVRLHTRLETRLAELKQPADPGRLEQELVLLLTRADVDEELDRLDAHIAEARRILELDEPVGRRLDFLMQEFNREANTLGAKAIDTRSSNAAVELKVLIEQMREQVQNIE